MIALEIARRPDIALEGVNFPGHFLLRVPGADHLLDPCSGRRLYPADCRELLIRQFGPTMQLRAEHMTRATPTSMLQRLSRNLRHLHQINDNALAALKDADRIVELGQSHQQRSPLAPVCISFLNARRPNVSIWNARCCSVKTHCKDSSLPSA